MRKRSRVRFRLALAASLRLRGFTQAVPPLRLPLPAANARPKRKGKTIPWAGKVFAGIPPGNAFAGVAPVNHRLRQVPFRASNCLASRRDAFTRNRNGLAHG